MLPPGLLPPGLIPGVGAPAAPPVDNTQRFHNFRILGMPANVVDAKLRDELVKIFGFQERNRFKPPEGHRTANGSHRVGGEGKSRGGRRQELALGERLREGS